MTGMIIGTLIRETKQMLTNEEIILLDNLMYLGKGEPDVEAETYSNLLEDYGADSYPDKTVEEWLNDIDLTMLEDEKTYGTCNYITGRDWKNIISAALNCENLKNMKIATTHVDRAEGGGGGFSALFIDPKGEEAVVAFRGTAGTDEWHDNLIGGNMAETPAQRNALNWYKKVYYVYDLEKYGTITATGHSKGGNKSKYITIMDDSVGRCVALDGQGFSDKFFIENSYQVAKNQNKIQNLCVDYDYVNLLLSDVGSRTYYSKQDLGEGGFLENHCPNTFLKFDEKGNVSIEINPNGQDPALKQLDEFFNGYLRSLSEEDRNATLEMMHKLLQRLFHAGQFSLSENAGYFIALLCKSEYSENAAELLAYLVKYESTHPEFLEKFMNLIRSLDGGLLALLIAAIIKEGVELSPVFPFYAKLYEPWFGILGNPYKKLSEVINGFLKIFSKKLKSVKINENGGDIWIGPLMPQIKRTSLSYEGNITDSEKESYKGSYFCCRLTAMRTEADNMIKNSVKYEQIISQVEGHAYSLTFSSSGSEAIKQSLLSVAAGMRKEKERLKSCGEALHKIVHIYETTENKVIESTQQVKPAGQNLPVGITGKALLTEKT